MKDRQLVKLIERNRIVTSMGHRIYGTAALLHWLRLKERKLRSFSESEIAAGRRFVENLLSA